VKCLENYKTNTVLSKTVVKSVWRQELSRDFEFDCTDHLCDGSRHAIGYVDLRGGWVLEGTVRGHYDTTVTVVFLAYHALFSQLELETVDYVSLLTVAIIIGAAMIFALSSKIVHYPSEAIEIFSVSSSPHLAIRLILVSYWLLFTEKTFGIVLDYVQLRSEKLEFTNRSNSN
jgi:hypothetical protein